MRLLTRLLVAGTFAIYPLKNFGAVQSGIHRFTHIWRNLSGKWQLTRILSYDHCNNCSTSIAPDFRTRR